VKKTLGTTGPDICFRHERLFEVITLASVYEEKCANIRP